MLDISDQCWLIFLYAKQQHESCVRALHGGLGIDLVDTDQGLMVSDEYHDDGEVDHQAFAETFDSTLVELAAWERRAILWAIAYQGLSSLQPAAMARLSMMSEMESAAAIANDPTDAEGNGADVVGGHVESEAVGFTLLDHVIIDQVVKSTLGEHGALDQDNVKALVDEFAFLNNKRPESFHHIGFGDSLLNRPFRERSGADNNERRGWYLLGWFNGRIRRVGARVAAEELAVLEKSDWKCLSLGPDTSPFSADSVGCELVE